MSKKILNEQIFSVNDIADALSLTARNIGGISTEQLLRMFIHSMKGIKGHMQYASPDAYGPYASPDAYGPYTYSHQPTVHDFWVEVEDALFATKAQQKPNQSNTKLHIKGTVDVGMYEDGDTKFFVVFSKDGDLEFDTWQAADKHISSVAIKARWVTENARPKLSTLDWVDDDEEDTGGIITTTLPKGTASLMGGTTSGLLPPLSISNASYLRKISNI